MCSGAWVVASVRVCVWASGCGCAYVGVGEGRCSSPLTPPAPPPWRAVNPWLSPASNSKCFVMDGSEKEQRPPPAKWRWMEEANTFYLWRPLLHAAALLRNPDLLHLVITARPPPHFLTPWCSACQQEACSLLGWIIFAQEYWWYMTSLVITSCNVSDIKMLWDCIRLPWLTLISGLSMAAVLFQQPLRASLFDRTFILEPKKSCVFWKR